MASTVMQVWQVLHTIHLGREESTEVMLYVIRFPSYSHGETLSCR